jgi:dUTP pyrophosphatase
LLLVKLLRDGAKAPTINHEGEDIAYDLYAADDITIPAQALAKIGTGIAIQFKPKAGAKIETRSGMASNGADTRGGCIDAGYRGEVKVIMKNDHPFEKMVVKRGDKIAQMERREVAKDKVKVVRELSESKRGAKGFGSSGK